MPTTADYRSSPIGTQPKYRIVLDPEQAAIGLNLWHDEKGSSVPIRGRFGPFEASQEQPRREESVIWDDFSNGMGQAFRTFPNMNAFTINGYTRTPRTFMPSGKLVEIDTSDWAEEIASKEITS